MRADESFFSRVGHDLRGELATILAGVHFLLRYETGLSPTGKQMLDRLNGAGQRLRQLLDELGDAGFATGESRPPPTILAVDLRAVVTKAIARIRTLAESRDVLVDDDSPAGDLGGLRGDAELLESALAYALALAVGRSRSARVSVAAEKTATGALVTITDRAGALPPERLARLVDPFVQKDALPRGDVAGRAGLGLGLAIARGILGMHGGDLTAELGPRGDGVRLVCTIGASPVAGAGG